MADLKTDYKDDVLDTEVNELRKYRMIQNEDGTVSFEDVTEYLQVGDSFGSADINETNAEIEEIKDNQEAKYQELENAIDTKVTNSFTANRAVFAGSEGKLITSGTVTSTELGYLDGVTSNIQTQLNGKVANSFTASRALITDGNGKATVSAVTSTELGYLGGVASAIQTQLNAKVTNSFTAYRALGTNASGEISVSPVTTSELRCLSGVTSDIQTQLNNIDTIATTANNNATKALKCFKAFAAQNDISATIGTASTYLFNNATGSSTDETVMTSVASGVYIKESGNYDISIAISVSLQQEDILNVGYRNFVSSSDYTDATQREYAKGYHHVGYHEIGAWLNAGVYVRPIISGSKGGDIGACSLTVIKR